MAAVADWSIYIMWYYYHSDKLFIKTSMSISL